MIAWFKTLLVYLDLQDLWFELVKFVGSGPFASCRVVRSSDKTWGGTENIQNPA